MRRQRGVNARNNINSVKTEEERNLKEANESEGKVKGKKKYTRQVKNGHKVTSNTYRGSGGCESKSRSQKEREEE